MALLALFRVRIVGEGGGLATEDAHPDVAIDSDAVAPPVHRGAARAACSAALAYVTIASPAAVVVVIVVVIVVVVIVVVVVVVIVERTHASRRRCWAGWRR